MLAAAAANPKVRNSVAGAMLAAIVGLYAQLGDVKAGVAAHERDRDALREAIGELKEQRSALTAIQVQLAHLEGPGARRR